MKNASDAASSGMRYVRIKFREDWYRFPSNIEALPQEFNRLQCCYY
jgi:hypothetical protein